MASLICKFVGSKSCSPFVAVFGPFDMHFRPFLVIDGTLKLALLDFRKRCTTLSILKQSLQTRLNATVAVLKWDGAHEGILSGTSRVLSDQLISTCSKSTCM